MVVLTERQTLKSAVIVEKCLTCVICEAGIEPSEATTGSLFANGKQAFACTDHLLRNRRHWITFWAAFDTEQRQLKKLLGGAR